MRQMMGYILLFLIGVVASPAQDPQPQMKPELQGLKSALDGLTVGLYNSFADKQAERLGDSAIADAISLYSPAGLNEEKNQIALARLIEVSFSKPELIEKSTDTVPRWSYIALSFLNVAITSDEGKKALLVATQVVDNQCHRISVTDAEKQACQSLSRVTVPSRK